MADIPEELKYLKTHEWAKLTEEGDVLVGISDYAQDALGDVVFVELPEPGADVSVGDEVAVVESVKAASDIYAPVSGQVVAVNDTLADAPELVNQSPYDNGWFFRIHPADTSELDELLSAADYAEHCEAESH